jgi:hypothetical protein
MSRAASRPCGLVVGGASTPNRKLQPVDDSDSIRDWREGTWTRLELIEMDERFRQAMRRAHPGMKRHEPERRQA